MHYEELISDKLDLEAQTPLFIELKLITVDDAHEMFFSKNKCARKHQLTRILIEAPYTETLKILHVMNHDDAQEGEPFPAQTILDEIENCFRDIGRYNELRRMYELQTRVQSNNEALVEKLRKSLDLSPAPWADFERFTALLVRCGYFAISDFSFIETIQKVDDSSVQDIEAACKSLLKKIIDEEGLDLKPLAEIIEILSDPESALTSLHLPMGSPSPSPTVSTVDIHGDVVILPSVQQLMKLPKKTKDIDDWSVLHAVLSCAKLPSNADKTKTFTILDKVFSPATIHTFINKTVNHPDEVALNRERPEMVEEFLFGILKKITPENKRLWKAVEDFFTVKVRQNFKLRKDLLNALQEYLRNEPGTESQRMLVKPSVDEFDRIMAEYRKINNQKYPSKETVHKALMSSGEVALAEKVLQENDDGWVEIVKDQLTKPADFALNLGILFRNLQTIIIHSRRYQANPFSSPNADILWSWLSKSATSLGDIMRIIDVDFDGMHEPDTENDLQSEFRSFLDQVIHSMLLAPALEENFVDCWKVMKPIEFIPFAVKYVSREVRLFDADRVDEWRMIASEELRNVTVLKDIILNRSSEIDLLFLEHLHSRDSNLARRILEKCKLLADDESPKNPSMRAAVPSHVNIDCLTGTGNEKFIGFLVPYLVQEGIYAPAQIGHGGQKAILQELLMYESFSKAVSACDRDNGLNFMDEIFSSDPPFSL